MQIRVAAAVVIAAFAGREAVAGQSLGRAAAEEAARRQALTAPARVITNSDLKQGPTSPLPDLPTSAVDDPVEAPFATRTPARLLSGPAPQIPVQAVSGADIAVEATVGRDGRVTAVDAIRHASPFTEALSAAVRSWTFEPATDTSAVPGGEGDARVVKTPVASKVLVVGLFRPPALFPGTLGTPPVDAGRPSETVPYPTGPPQLPAFPPNALMDGVVVVELVVGPDGAIGRARAVRSAAGFDQPALQAAQAIGFRPARVHGRPSPALVYVVAGFRQPVTP